MLFKKFAAAFSGESGVCARVCEFGESFFGNPVIFEIKPPGEFLNATVHSTVADNFS